MSPLHLPIWDFLCVCVHVCMRVCVVLFLYHSFFFPFLLLFSWAVVWVNLAWGGMYIIKTGLGFVGCQSINQSEFNYQACDGKRWQAPGLLDSISYGAAATKNKKLESMCAWVDAGWEGGGETWGGGGEEKWRRRKGERKSWGVLQLESTITRGKKKKFCVLKTKTTSLYFKTKIKGFELNFPCFAWNMSACSECYLMPALTYTTLKCTPLFNTCKHFIRNIFLKGKKITTVERTHRGYGAGRSWRTIVLQNDIMC